MRVVGYILLLLLTLYFLLLKPYMLAQRIELDLKGLKVSLKEGIGFESFLLYVPAGHTHLHLFLRRVSLQPWRFQAEELSFIEVSTAPPSDKPFDYDFTTLTRFAERLNLRVDKIYISINYIPHSESLTLYTQGGAEGWQAPSGVGQGLTGCMDRVQPLRGLFPWSLRGRRRASRRRGEGKERALLFSAEGFL
ncbi:MAG: hypothetical protein ABDH29_04700 [Aquificaceae bacterium]